MVASMKQKIINVQGMECEGCENRIQNILKNIKGVKEVIANHINGTVTITAQEEININEVKEKINKIGFIVKDEK